jgi:hypothetical protein
VAHLTLDDWKEATKIGGQRTCIEVKQINRPILKEALAIYKRPTLDLRPTPHVTFLGEMGEDDGGLSIEVFVPLHQRPFITSWSRISPCLMARMGIRCQVPIKYGLTVILG